MKIDFRGFGLTFLTGTCTLRNVSFRAIRRVMRNVLMMLTAAVWAAGAGAIDVKVKPNKDVRQAIPIDKGPIADTFSLLADDPWEIKESDISLKSDLTLWSKVDKANYKLMNAFSSLEYVTIAGHLVKAKKGVGTENGDPPWYAIPIAKRESRLRQFNTSGVLGPNPSDIQFCPNFGPPNGWGIFQLDNPRPSAQQLWNWKGNVAGGKARLANPCRIEAEAWIASQETQQRAEEPTKPLENYVFTFHGIDFQKGTARTPIDACTIQRYNGAANWVIYWNNKTPTTPGSWEINPGYRQYVDNVCAEID